MNKNWRAASRVAKTVVLSAAAVIAITLAVLALRPAPEGIPAWATTAPISFGTAVDRSGITLVTVPTEALPIGAFVAETNPVGALADRYIPEGTVLAETDVRGSERTRLLQSGETLLEMPAPLGSSLSLQTGEVLDLWGQVQDCEDTLCPPERIAAGVRVLQVTEADSSAWGGESAMLVSLAVPSTATGRILQAESNQTLQYALRATGGD